MLESRKDEGLKREIGVRALMANTINMVVGAGIFALPAGVAGFLGPSFIFAYLLCALLLSLVLMCFVELGTKITVTGGVYAYTELAFGPLAGFLTNTLFWFGYAAMADAAIANVLADNLSIMVPAFRNWGWRALLFSLMFGGIAAVNVRGVKESSRFVEIVTLVKLSPLVLLVVAGFFHVSASNFRPFEIPEPALLGQASLFLFFAFGGGAEAALSASGEIRNPARTIPRGIFGGIAIVFVLYTCVQAVSQGLLGPTLSSLKEAPLASVAAAVFGPPGTYLLLCTAMLSCFGLVSGDILATSRLPYAAARDGLLPKWLAKIHPRFATPHRAIWMYAGIGFLMSVSGGFHQLATLASSAILVIYIGVLSASIRLRRLKAEGSFRLPGGILVPLLALGITFWFLSNLQVGEMMAAATFLAASTVVYFLMRLVKQKP
jgi:amino acid transporter